MDNNNFKESTYKSYKKRDNNLEAKGHLKYKEKGEPKLIKTVRYNEKQTTLKFLLSKRGFSLLTDIGKSSSFSSKNTIEELGKLIDFYSSWTSSFPVRKNLKVSKYDFLKSVEDFCLKPENMQAIEPILEKQDELY